MRGRPCRNGGLVLHLLALAATMIAAPGTPHVPRAIGPVTLSAAEIASLLDSPHRRVRAYTDLLAWHVAEGVRRSPTFASMVRALEHTDVIVQFVEAVKLPPLTDAQAVLVDNAREFRFVRVYVGDERRGDNLIALLGHELMHALEIAWAPEVRDARALDALYRRIGIRGPRPQQYDTQEARLMERRVHRELASGMRTAAPDADAATRPR